MKDYMMWDHRVFQLIEAVTGHLQAYYCISIK